MRKPPSQNHYETLRVDRQASPQRVRLAYRRLAQKFHPDKYQGRGDSANLMAQINQAYAVLSDPAQRAAYDARLQSESAPQTQPVRNAATAMAAMQDRFGWSGWLLLAIASISVLTLGFVALRALAPARPVFQAPMATAAPVPAVDTAPLAPVPAIQPWVEPPRKTRVVNAATEPVERLVRDGVVSKAAGITAAPPKP